MYVTIFVTDWGQKKHLAKSVLKRTVLKQSLPNFQHQLLPASPRAATGLRPVAAQASVSERGRSALFKNPLFFSGKFLGCYIEAAQNFIRYVTIFDRDRGQKTSLTKLVLKRSVLKQSLPNFQHKLL